VNIVLAVMGVMVHGIRLNTLEFASHLGLQWSGISLPTVAAQAGNCGLTGTLRFPDSRARLPYATRGD
jgi:hypothetical protein